MTMDHIKPVIDKDENTLLIYGLGGSQSYGMATPNSDFDYSGIYLQDPKQCFINPYLDYTQQFQFKDGDHEGTVYEFKKAIKLIADNNPNMIELIWRDHSSISYISDIGLLLQQYAPLLLCKKSKFTFSGYAHSQFKRIKGHTKWINNPQPKDAPILDDFIIGYKHADKDSAIYDKQAYKDAKAKHNQYWEWKENRNPNRSALEELHGYDTKHAAHLIRLMRMGIEILDEGVVKVMRPDAQELLDIRKGKYTYDELSDEFYALESQINSLYETSSLRKSVDPRTLINLYSEVWEIYHA